MLTLTTSRHVTGQCAAAAIALAVASIAPASAEEQLSVLPDIDSMKAQYRRPAEIPFPDDNPYSDAKKELGHNLFFDPRLSGSNSIACASCHNPSLGWEDALPTGMGHGMKPLGRHTPTVINLAWGELYFWDGRAASLEEQALGPVQADVEMNQSLEELIEELAAIDGYPVLFERAYGDPEITGPRLAMAIATYERTLVSGAAPFDRWVNGDEDAISESAKRGFVLFNGEANCVACHSGWRLSDDSFHDIGLPDDDLGRGELIPGVKPLEHAFKTPNLREIQQRAPYMHDGSLATLRDVVDHYADGFVERESLSSEIRPLDLDEQQRDDLVAFMRTLSGAGEPVTVPVLP